MLEELFVLRGAFSDGYGRYARHTWLRLPPGSYHAPETEQGCLLYVKSGGFPPQPGGFR
ncbi:MAG TPA: cupin domain-containing protein [Polyangiaceae bacterium]